MSILDDSTEDHIASSGFIPGTQFTRTKTVSLLDQIKEREREEKLENLFESGALYSSSKKDEDDVDELLEIFGGEEDARFEDDDDDDVERKQEEEEDARNFRRRWKEQFWPADLESGCRQLDGRHEAQNFGTLRRRISKWIGDG